MKRTIQVVCLISISVLIAAPALAQDLIVYPAKGQGQKQMEKDKFDCYTWAKQQTGFDPMKTPTASTPPPAQGAPQGGAGRGAARGALGGLAIGSLAGEAGKGAAIGAIGGGLIGGMKRRDQARRQETAEQKWAEQQASDYYHKRDKYNRAYGACLEAKGYTVK